MAGSSPAVATIYTAMIVPETFCALAYNGISVNQDGSLDPCCQYRPDQPSAVKFTDYKTFVNTVRRQMHEDHIAGRKHLGCRKCWHEEELGLKSLRYYSNTQWYKDNATPEVSEHNPLLDIELRFGNTCNLKCMMCTPKASSALYVERLQNSQLFQQTNVPGLMVMHEKIPEWWIDQEFKDFSTKLFADAVRVNITGGEPFMIGATVDVMETLMPRRDSVKLCFNTNLTKLPVAIQQRLSLFKHVTLSVSLEGIGSMAEYLRYPCKWSEVDSNIQKVIDILGVESIFVNHTLQHGSIYSLPALAEYCHSHRIKIHFTMVQGIDCLSLHSVPRADCDKFLHWLDSTESLPTNDKNFLRNGILASEFNQDQYQNFRRYVDVLDQIRNTSWDSVFSPSPVDHFTLEF